MNILDSIHPKRVLLLAQAPQHYYRSPLVEGSEQIFIGPDVDTTYLNQPREAIAIKLDPLWLNAEKLNLQLRRIGFHPDLVFVKADATCRNHIKGIDALPGLKILLMGDTHHLPNPLQTMIHYANSEPWDLISSEHDRHHLPLFSQSGLNQLIWLPCFTMNPYEFKPQTAKFPGVVFVGSLSSHHQQRSRLIGQLISKGLPMRVTKAPQADASVLYNEAAISLNVSLNGDLNFRVMEILAAGGCLLTDRLGPDSGLNELLTEGVHYVGYSSSAEAALQIEHLLDSPEQRLAIAKAGFNRFWSYFSPRIQTKVLLDALSGKEIPQLFRSPH